MDAMTKELGFDKFWNEHWPKCRRKQKKQTWDQWKKIDPSLYETIYAAVDRQKKQPQWLKDDCAYIPYPHRWLRDRRWEDEITPSILVGEGRAEANILISALRRSAVMPADLPAPIAAKFRAMYERWRGKNHEIPNPTWPVLHGLLKSGALTDEQLREQYTK